MPCLVRQRRKSANSIRKKISDLIDNARKQRSDPRGRGTVKGDREWLQFRSACTGFDFHRWNRTIETVALRGRRV